MSGGMRSEMSVSARRFAAGWRVLLTATFALLRLASVHAEDLPKVDTDATVQVPAFTLPPSEYWSPEFKAAYAKVVSAAIARSRLDAKAKANASAYTQPAAGAPKAEWDEYDNHCDRQVADVLAWEREHYPVELTETRIGGVKVSRVTPRAGVAAENRQRVLIQLRGASCGGLSLGQLEAIPVAFFGKIEVVVVDFRPAPRYPFPASIEDVAAVYTGLMKQYTPDRIGVFGTSGGGILTAQFVAWCQATSLPRPGAIGIFWSGIPAWPYPFGKFGDSLLWEFGVPRSDHTQYDAMISKIAEYIHSAAPDDPRAYPMSSATALAKFPSTLFVTGGRALDMSAAVTSHARLLKLGVDSYLYVMEGAWHAASYGTLGSPEERDANTYIGRWFGQHLAR